MAKKVKILPRTPSALLRLGLRDLEAVEKMKKRYRIEMGAWYEKGHQDGAKCLVCFAGSVMVRSLKTPAPSGPAVLCPGDFPENHEQLGALNSLREGMAKEAMQNLGYDVDQFCAVLGSRPPRPPEYAHNPRAFKRAVRALADHFESYGL